MKRMELTQLPYSMEALEPHIGRLTMEFHHGKHHRAYIDNLNKLIAGTKFETMTPEEIIKNSEGSIYNNAAQAWNHDFYWNCLSPEGTKEPSSGLLHAMDKKFGGFDEFKTQFNISERLSSNPPLSRNFPHNLLCGFAYQDNKHVPRHRKPKEGFCFLLSDYLHSGLKLSPTYLLHL